ncbi:MAG TPA: YeeE/YedE family protein [Thiotrichaceae bacterium]|jgi:uncharacterized membrane protein YedE/YeeE|nr:YeeE/YedE family protein [Thiotrichaceae bacterium]HIM08057.1 YeeE/YedE family protein [Gammaproteobacteria bacterium]
MENFTPYSALAGGVLLGISASLLLLFNGRIAGISGILSGVFTTSNSAEKVWRLLFLLGMVVAGFTYQLLFPDSFVEREDFPLSLLLIGAFIVGFGTRMGGGCTSGHGVCGIGRLSKRSIIATVVFMTSGVATVYVIRHVFGAVL